MDLNLTNSVRVQLNCTVVLLNQPTYSGLIHSKAMHLLDLCILDIGSLDYSYSSLAASALYFIQESQLPSGMRYF